MGLLKMRKAPAPPKPKRSVLKLRKSPTGTKHTTRRVSAKELTPKQLEKLRKVGRENVRVRRSQTGVLDDYYKKSRSPVYNREPVHKPRGVFYNVPISEIRLDPKIGTMVFTQEYQGKPKQYRITRNELLKNDYYKEVGLFNSLLDSRKYSSGESSASVNKRIYTQKSKR